jgi:putative endonuclease
MPAFTVYLLVSLDHDFHYVGFAEDHPFRLAAHNRGRTKSTAPYRPFRLVILRTVPDRESARRSERYFKSGQGRAQIERLLELERKRGVHIIDAEHESLIRNPFAVKP